MSTEYSEEYCFLNPECGDILQNFVDIEPFDKPIEKEYLQILNYLLENPDKNAKDIENASLEGLKGHSYKTIWRYIKYLTNDLKLIELVSRKTRKYQE